MKLERWHYGLSGGVILVFAAVIVYLNTWFWGRLDDASRAAMVASSLGAAGTLVLAGATLVTIRQQAETIDDLQKDREKPLAIDEIANVINYAISGLEFNLETLRGEEGFNWVVGDGSTPAKVMEQPRAVLKQNPDHTALARLRRDEPELEEGLREYEELIEEIAALGSRVADEIYPIVTEYVEEREIRNSRGDEPDIDYLVYAVVKRAERFGESHQLHQVWEEHGEMLIGASRASDESRIGALKRKEQELMMDSVSLLNALSVRKLELREEYGISTKEISEEKSSLEKVTGR